MVIDKQIGFFFHQKGSITKNSPNLFLAKAPAKLHWGAHNAPQAL